MKKTIYFLWGLLMLFSINLSLNAQSTSARLQIYNAYVAAVNNKTAIINADPVLHQQAVNSGWFDKMAVGLQNAQNYRDGINIPSVPVPAIGGGGNICANMDPFCTAAGSTYPAGVNTGTAESGPSYGCLGSQPNPVWYYMKILTGGDLHITETNSNNIDVDFILWGPFPNTDVCTQLAAGKIVDCSYSSVATEYIDIASCNAGEYYILLVTNFSNNATNITLAKTSGSAETDCAIVNPIPGAPVATEATNITNTTFIAHWDVVGGVTDYKIDVATDNGFTNILPSYSDLSVGTLGYYTITGVTTNTDYYYRVRAVNANGTSGNSNIILVHTVSPSSCPITSNDITVSSGVNGQLNASGATFYSWTPSTGLNDPNIANPIVNITSSNPATFIYYVTGYTEKPTNLIVNGDFEAGNSGFSSTYTYCNSSNCLYPEGYYAVGNNPNSFHNNFATCHDNTSGSGNMLIANGDPIANKKVWYQNVTVTPNTDYAFSAYVTTVINVNPPTLQFSINGSLLGSPTTFSSTPCTWSKFYQVWNSGSNTNIEISITNQNTVANGNDFAIDDIKFIELCRAKNMVLVSVILAPSPPVATAATSITDNSFNSNWDASNNSTGYYLDVATDNGFTNFVSGYNNKDVGNVTTYPVNGLSGGTIYYYRVRAYNTSGTSTNSNVITVLTIPSPPVASTATSIGVNNYTANWNASNGASGYYLDVATDNGFTNFVSGYNNKDVGNVLTYNVNGLAGGTVYYYRVRAYNASGTSFNSNIISVLTIPEPPVATPETNRTLHSFQANWQLSFGAVGYYIDVATDPNFVFIIPAYNNLYTGNVSTYTISGLYENTPYYYRLRAFNASGTSPNSNVIIVRRCPIITWANPADIVYGTPLSGTQLDATANVPGTYVYLPAGGTVLTTGENQDLIVTFTPNDLTNYCVISKVVQINVLKADPVITWANPTDIPYGTLLGNTQLNATANTPGAYIYTPSGGTLLPLGPNQDLTVTFSPTDDINYNTVNRMVHINVVKTDPVIVWADPADVVYGTPLSPTQLNAVSTIPGIWVYTPAAGTVLNAGANQNLSVTFTPYDISIYNVVSKTVHMNISKAPLSITADDKTITYGDNIPVLTYTLNGFVNGESSTVLSGAPSISTTATSSSNTGTYPINISVGGLTALNYAFTFINGTLTIVKADQTITVSPIPNQYIGNTFTPVAVASSGLPVTYTVSPPTIAKITGNEILVIGAGTAIIIFNQAGNNNYNPVTETITFTTLEIKFPGLITPNGDGHNDTWSVPLAAEALNGADVTIYNSYGQQMFKTSGYGSWDGMHNSKVCPTGEYYYIIKTSSGVTYKGIILLMK